MDPSPFVTWTKRQHWDGHQPSIVGDWDFCRRPIHTYMMSASPPKETDVEQGGPSPENSEHMDRADPDAQARDLAYEFEVKEQDRWLPIANGSFFSCHHVMHLPLLLCSSRTGRRWWSLSLLKGSGVAPAHMRVLLVSSLDVEDLRRHPPPFLSIRWFTLFAASGRS